MCHVDRLNILQLYILYFYMKSLYIIYFYIIIFLSAYIFIFLILYFSTFKQISPSPISIFILGLRACACGVLQLE